MAHSRLAKSAAVGVAAAVAFTAVSLTGQQPPPSGPFTAAQARAGATAYQTNCAACHQPDLRGQGTATTLVGPEFIGAWGSRSAGQLLSFIQLTMPPASPGVLPAETYASIAAFILQSNGARAGNQPLTPNTQASIGSVASGEAPRPRLRAPRPPSDKTAADEAAGRPSPQESPSQDKYATTFR